MDVYLAGDVVTVSTVITDSSGTAADPTALTLTYTNGTTTSTLHWPTPAEITRDLAGRFHADLTGLTAGHYRYVWTSTGANAGADVDVFDVLDTATPRLVSLADAKGFLRLSGTADDALLDRIIVWATARINQEIQAATETVTSRVTGRGSVLLLPRTPVQEVTAITPVGLIGVAVDVTSVWVESPLAGLVRTTGWFYGAYDVTYTAGPAQATVAAGADGACLHLIRHWWNQSQAHGSATYGDEGFTPTDFPDLPNSVKNLLASSPPRPPLMA